MLIEKMHFVTIYYNEGEEAKAQALAAKYTEQGYNSLDEDTGDPVSDFSIQVSKVFPKYEKA